MATHRWTKLAFVLWLGVALRVLCFRNFGGNLSERPELVTPQSSMLRLLEGRWLGIVFGDPYHADGFHGPPILLHTVNSIIDHVPGASDSPELTCMFICAICDVLVALVLYGIAAASNGKDELSDGPYQDPDEIGVSAKAGGKLEYLDYRNGFQLESTVTPLVPATAYLLNPVSILTCGSLSICSLPYFLCLLAMWTVSGRNRLKEVGKAPQRRLSIVWVVCSAMALGLAGQFDLYWLCLTPSCALLWSRHRPENKLKTKLMCLCAYTIVVGIMWSLVFWYSLNVLSQGSTSFVAQTFGWAYQLGDLSPNIGIWWYFWAELFERFRNYFLFIFNVHPYLYVVPFAIQFHNRPLMLSTITMGIYIIFQAYPQMNGLCLLLALACMHPKTLGRMKMVFVYTIILVAPLCLLPVMWDMWLRTGSGNANFYYFQTLAIVMLSSFLLMEFVAATLRRDRIAKKWFRGNADLVQLKKTS